LHLDLGVLVSWFALTDIFNCFTSFFGLPWYTLQSCGSQPS